MIGLKQLSILRIVCLLIAIQRSENLQPAIAVTPNHATGADVLVEVARVVAYGTPAHPLYQVSYSYRFANRPTVFLAGGLGTVPAAGAFTYYSKNLELIFMDGPKGRVIVKVPLEVTFVPQGGGAEPRPGASDFSLAGQEADRKGTEADFKLVSDKVLNSMGLNYQACVPTSSCVLTDYAALNFPAHHGEKAQIALRISYVQQHKDSVHFVISSKVQEKLSHGSWLDPDDPVVDTAAKAFVKQVMQSLESSM